MDKTTPPLVDMSPEAYERFLEDYEYRRKLLSEIKNQLAL